MRSSRVFECIYAQLHRAVFITACLNTQRHNLLIYLLSINYYLLINLVPYRDLQPGFLLCGLFRQISINIDLIGSDTKFSP